MELVKNMYSPPSSTFGSDRTPAAEQQCLPPDDLSNSTEPVRTPGGQGIYVRLLNLWHAATSRTPGPSRMIVQQCPRCGALSASPDGALLQTWLRIHCCEARQWGKDAP